MAKGTQEIGQLAVSLALDAQTFDKQITAINKEIKNSERTFKNAGKGVEGFEKSFQGLDSKIQATSKQLDLHNVKLTKQKEAYSKLESTLSTQKNKLDELEKTLGKNSQEWQDQALLVQKNSEKLSKLGTDISITENNIYKLSKELDSSKSKFEELGKKTKSLDENLSDISRQANLSESHFNKLGSELQDSGTYLDKLGNELTKLNSKIETNTKKINAYETEISRLEKVLNESKEQHKNLAKEIGSTENELEKAKDKYGENSKEVQQLRAKLMQLKDEYNGLENEIEQGNNSLQECQTELNNTKVEVSQLSKELKSMPFEKVGQDLQSAGEKIKGIGNSLTVGVTMPIAAATGASAKFAMDFETGMAKVGTIADTTKVPIEDLKEGVIDLSNKTSQSTDDLNEALYQAISASVDTADAVDFLDVSVKAAVGGFSDTTTAVNGLSTVINSYGLEAKEADRIANQMLITQNAGKTSFDELASSVGKVTPVASALGVSTEELFSSLAVTTAQGLATAESVTALKAAMSNIIKPSKEAQDAAEALGIEFSVSALQSKGWIGFLDDVKGGLQQASPELDVLVTAMDKATKKMSDLEVAGKKNTEEYKNAKQDLKAFSKELDILANMADSPISAMATMFGSVEGLNSILMLTSEQGMDKYNQTMDEMATNTGALDKAYEQMSDTTEFKFKKAMNESKNALMELGSVLLPVINDALGLLSGLIEKFNELSPSQQENILKMAMMAAVIGPVLSGVGSLTSGIGGLVKTGSSVLGFFSKFSGGATAVATATQTVGTSAAVAGGAGGLGALVSSLGATVVSFWPLIAIAGGAGLAFSAFNKVMSQEVVPSVDLFADSIQTSTTMVEGYGEVVQAETVKISDATKEAVGAYLAMDEGVTNALTGMYITSETITDETCNSMIAKYQEMGSVITTGIEEDKTNDLNTLSQFFGNSVLLTEEQEAEMLKITQIAYDTKKMTVEETQARISEILQQAKEENRALKEEEVQEISTLQDNMKTQAVKTLSEQEKEAQVILDRMKAYDERVTAEQASQHIKTLNEQRDKAIDSANSEYREVVSTIETMRDDLGVISADQAEALIADAERQRDETIQAAKDTRNDAVTELEGMCTDLSDSVDTSTGDILTKWDRLKNWWDGWKPGKKKFETEHKETTVKNTITGNQIKSIPERASIPYTFNEVSDIDNIPKIDISRYVTRGAYFSSNSPQSKSLSTTNTVSVRSNGTGEKTEFNLNFDKVEIKNDDDYKTFAKKIVGHIDVELNKMRNKNQRGKGGLVHA